MSNDSAVGFWSYTHDDNILDGDSILQLSRLIMEEYNLLSGEPLDLFVDRNDLAWGEEWRARIDSSLAEATFFIPIITPRYFTRPECRRELLEFAAKAEMLGAKELLLPILYIETHGLSAESPDEAVALVAKTQYVDWHDNRLLEPNSREYRRAVNALARRLLNIARHVAEVQLNRELNSNPEDNGTDGVADIATRIETLLPEWLDAVMIQKSVSPQIEAVWREYERQIAKLTRQRARSSVILSAQIRMVRQMLPLAEQSLKNSQIYLARSIELDTLVSALSRLVAEYPDSFSFIISIREAIDEAMEAIRKNDNIIYEDTIRSSLHPMGHLGRVFKQVNSAFDARARNAIEGNDIVRRWDAELIDHNSSRLEQSSPAVVNDENANTGEG
jgi:hypothetical protein